MSDYTMLRDLQGYDIEPDSDDYVEQLIHVMQSFCDYDEALDAFICSKGYRGSLENRDEKIEFIKARYNQAGITKASNRHQWYKNNKVGRKPAFELCFAFGLSVSEANELFRKMCLQRGFDCHDIEEAIYYYGLRNGLSFQEVVSLIEAAPKTTNGNINQSSDILYTASIVEQLDHIKDTQQLLAYFERNIDQFSYNNATAHRTVVNIWKEITKPDGLAAQERKYLYSDLDEDADIRRINEMRSRKKLEAENGEEKEQSVWDIYLQILQIDNEYVRNMKSDRSLKPILQDNPLLHKLAEQEFPDRQSITKILSGKRVKDERVRKTMILLLFYRYWVKCKLEHYRRGEAVNMADKTEADRCRENMNQFLVEAGYPELYSGNPYDWIFLFTMQDADPLQTFREFISELYLYKEDAFREVY